MLSRRRSRALPPSPALPRSACCLIILPPRYGYIQTQNGKIKNFIEKPSRAKAEEMIAAGNCFWNTGIFICAPDYFLKKLEELRPDIFDAAQKAYTSNQQKADGLYFDEALYDAIPHEAVDYTIMEKLTDANCVELKSHWNDMGTWPESDKGNLRHFSQDHFPREAVKKIGAASSL